jgi:hypothetical protein
VGTAVRVLVVGSVRCTDDEAIRDRIRKAGHELGRCLAERGHTILVGSDNQYDIDPSVVEGALEAGNKTTIEVHLMQGAPECYPNLSQSGAIRNVPHRYHDWDVTVLEVLRGSAEGVIALGGNIGVVQTGVAGWMLGRAVIPIAAFGGGAQKVWGYGSGERQQFYFGALSDIEIDRLTSAWNTHDTDGSARFVVDALERVAQRAKLSTSPKGFLVIVSTLVLVMLVAWVALLAAPLVGSLEWLGWRPVTEAAASGVRFLLLLVSVCTAGALGALMQTLRRMRDGQLVKGQRIVIDGVLGIAAGFLTAALYLVAQIAVTGSLELPETDADYARIALIVGLAALFSSLYLDAALARFDSLKDSVMAGKHGTATREEP